MAALVPVLQFLAALIFALVAGSVFGIWRGYDPSTYAATTFLEMHQGAVRGLNVLLPALGLAASLLTAALLWFARGKGLVFWLYLAAVLMMIGAGIVTRFLNQPINALVMGWTPATLPADWEALRAAWWQWHLLRVGLSLSGLALLLAAVILDRPALP